MGQRRRSRLPKGPKPNRDIMDRQAALAHLQSRKPTAPFRPSERPLFLEKLALHLQGRGGIPLREVEDKFGGWAPDEFSIVFDFCDDVTDFIEETRRTKFPLGKSCKSFWRQCSYHGLGRARRGDISVVAQGLDLDRKEAKVIVHQDIAFTKFSTIGEIRAIKSKSTRRKVVSTDEKNEPTFAT